MEMACLDLRKEKDDDREGIHDSIIIESFVLH